MLATLLELAVPHEDIGDVLAIRLTAAERDLIRAHVATLGRHMGAIASPPPRFQPSPESHPLFYVLVYASAMAQVRSYHRQRAIPAAISRLTLADVGRSVAVHKRRTGIAGIDPVHWLQLHFCGTRYQLGRLQFEQAILDGEPVLSLHIPSFCGPLTPAAVAASLRLATAFFRRHFPEIRYRRAICHSWLLDGQLAEYLPAESNILRFQRRFTPLGPGKEDDASIQRFVFPGTPLHQAVIDHLASGHHWRIGSGWFAL